MGDASTRQLAGLVRKLLEERGSLAIEEVVTALRVGTPLVFEAFGWMSREDSIVIEGNRVRLRSDEGHAPYQRR